jgi:hypothetical protein
MRGRTAVINIRGHEFDRHLAEIREICPKRGQVKVWIFTYTSIVNAWLNPEDLEVLK